jgi:hypothetical protein
MADKKQQAGADGPQQHPLIDRLTGGAGAQPPDVSVLFGYPARDPQPGFWRIYENLGFQSYLRVAEDDIVSTHTLATDEEPLRPAVVWVRRGADLEQTRVEARRLQAGFLQGPLVEGLGGFASGATARGRAVRRFTGDPEICSIDLCPSRDFGGCFTRRADCASELFICDGGGGGGDTNNAFCPTREFVCRATVGPECGL